MKVSTATVIATFAAMLGGCANKYEVVTPELQASMMADLRAGKLSLDCGLNCKLTWETQAAAVHALDIAERWPDLAVRVMQIGYGSDLAYYYLGQAAQGLQFHDAAIGYYNYASAISAGVDPLLRCEGGQTGSSDPCQGVNLADSIPVLVQASRDALAEAQAQEAAAQAPTPVVHHHHHKAVAASAQSGSQWATPPAPSSDTTGTRSAGASTGSGTDQGWATPPAKQ